MAELEALAEIKAATGGTSVAPGQYTWRYPLPENKVIRLGSDPGKADWVVPEDKMISRLHATLEWNGTTLTVMRRAVTPDFPKPPQNHIWFRNNAVEKCEVRPGEWFVIGQTRFALRGDQDAAPPAPVDATIVQQKVEYTRAELENLTFSDPVTILKAMEQIPNVLKMAVNEPSLFRQMLKVALTGLPKADAAAVVRIPPDSGPNDLRVAVVEQNVRGSQAAMAAEFVPSRKLVRQAFRERKSCLHIWSTNPEDIDPAAGTDHTLTLGAMFQSGATPWAVCTPFQDGSPFALYISGRARPDGGGPAKVESKSLTDYQKFGEILVGLIETTRRTLKVIRQNQLLQGAWPTSLRKYLDDPDKMEGMLKPRETNVTVLFCDLRNYSGYAEEHGSDLMAAQRDIQFALDTMSGGVTQKGGIVAGFRGDAVLGFWGWPDGADAQIEAAMAAALLIRERLTGSMFQKRCGLGVTHGRAIAGRLGAHDLGVVDLYGPVVNLAFRLEEMTKAFGVGIVLNDTVANKILERDPNGQLCRLRLLGLVRPRGMKVPLRAFELSPTSGNTWLTGEWYQSQLAQWNEAVEWFIAGEWGSARERLGDLFESDPVAQCLIRHMDKTRGKPPPDWDGAFLPTPPST
ncbi:adenylate/guanylate cyclase domain-containing protein [Gemmata sp.]|uniref:adenylate/guanylate cyclase domain-containing protein n=1 Tax=Gemmata sp. TaxID=1914242 RepID=UPI003F6F0F11